MHWDIEERVEDVFGAYLKTGLPSTISVIPAWSAGELTYPCCVVAAGESANVVSELAEFEPNRMMEVAIALAIEALPELDENGNVIRTARQRNRALRSTFLDMLAWNRLQERLSGLAAADGIVISMAQLGETTREVDAEKRLLISTATLEVIAGPAVEG